MLECHRDILLVKYLHNLDAILYNNADDQDGDFDDEDVRRERD